MLVIAGYRRWYCNVSFLQILLMIVQNPAILTLSYHIQSAQRDSDSWIDRRTRHEPFLTPRDFDAAEYEPARGPTNDGLLAMQNPALIEGDITGFHEEDDSMFDRPQTVPADPFAFPHHTAVNLKTFPEKLWDGGRVPYVLDEQLAGEERVAVAQAFEEYIQKTCVHFVPKRAGDVDYIFIKRNRCSSFVGRAGGNQTVSLEVGKCFTKGIIAHELMHVLGFFHEHSRTDRDKFVRIVNRNVIPGMLKNFEKYSNNILDTLKMPYDYGSVMHYHKLAFSRNGRATVLPVEPTAVIGQRLQLSRVDRDKINKLYRCEGKLAGKDATTGAPVDPLGCVDQHDHCKLWADLGHCRWSMKYMKSRCRLSCDLCAENSTVKKKKAEKSDCADRNLFCPYWARIGECKNEKKFMAVYCQQSCELCPRK